MALLDRLANLPVLGPGPPPPTPESWTSRDSLGIETAKYGARIIPIDGAELIFDATISEQHTETLDLTEHPVEEGLDITDHAIIRPVEVQLINVMTLTPLIGDTAVPRRHFDLYERLRELWRLRQPVALVTRLRAYESLIITEVSTPITADDGESLVPSVRLREVRIVQGQTAKLPPEYLAPSVSDVAAAEIDEGSQPADTPTAEEEGAGRTWAATLDDESGGRALNALGAGLEVLGFTPAPVP